MTPILGSNMKMMLNASLLCTKLVVYYSILFVALIFIALFLWQVLISVTNNGMSMNHFESLRQAIQLTSNVLKSVARVLLTVTPVLAWLQLLASKILRVFKGAVESVVSAGSAKLIGEKDITPRKTFSINGKIMVGMFTIYFLRPTIQMVIETSKMNYRITRIIRRTGQKATHFLQMLLVLPLSFLQMFDLFSIMFDTFLTIFQIFFKVIEIGFYYAILIFRTYKIFVLCCTAIMKSVYITAFYSILLVHSGLTCLKAFTGLLQHSAVRQALISYKEHKKRAHRQSAISG